MGQQAAQPCCLCGGAALERCIARRRRGLRQQRCAAGVQRLERGFALRCQRLQHAVGQHHGRPAIAGLNLAPHIFTELNHILWRYLCTGTAFHLQ
ncbi:hypothetical protein D3C76_1187860 [compost metagenome]